MLNAAWVRWLPVGNPGLRANLLSAVVAVFATGYRVSDAEVCYLVSWMMLGVWCGVGL